ncbi:hypothetical protein VNO78_07529 [Psophocarpus tetragonolobus]|uniref:Uncharacterized protein n=1 Tax=Psophocarpus tetragonolobus TaxID=3891 RepID=A0AAN9SUS5_PSOTE
MGCVSPETHPEPTLESNSKVIEVPSPLVLRQETKALIISDKVMMELTTSILEGLQGIPPNLEGEDPEDDSSRNRVSKGTLKFSLITILGPKKAKQGNPDSSSPSSLAIPSPYALRGFFIEAFDPTKRLTFTSDSGCELLSQADMLTNW